MRIICIEYARFGTLRIDSPVELSEGINLVVAPNQAGKSTLLTLIEWMLYGVPQRGPRTKNVALVQEWTPWNGDKCEATIVVLPQLDDWPKRLRIDADFENFRLRLTDPDTGENLTDNVRISANGTWDLGSQLTSLERKSMLASLIAPQGQMDNVLQAEELRKALLSDLSELVEDPERANLESALAALDRPTFTMPPEQESAVQMPKLLRDSDSTLKMRRGELDSLQEQYDQAEKLLISSAEAEQQQARESVRLEKLKRGLQEMELAAACWRYGRLQSLKSRLDGWQGKISENPWIVDFPAQLETDAESQYASYRKLVEVIDDRQRRLQDLSQRLTNLEHQLKQNERLIPLVDHRQQIAGVAAAIESAQKDLASAEEDRREYGEAADPATRERFEQIDLKLSNHREYLEALKSWHGRSAEISSGREALETRKSELSRSILSGRPWQLWLALVLLVIAISGFVAGPKMISPDFAAWAGSGVLVILAAWLGVSASRITRESDKAAVELDRVVMPQLAELLENETQLEADARLLREHHAISTDEWAGVMQVLPDYKELNYRLEAYARACRERDSASERIAAAWQSLDDLTGAAVQKPPHPDLQWIGKLLDTLDSVKQAAEQLANQNASLREEEREVSRHIGDRDEQLRQLAKLLTPLGLHSLAGDNPAKAMGKLAESAEQAREYRQLQSEYNNERDKASALDITEDEFNAEFNRLDPAEQSKLAGTVPDEKGYDKLIWDIRGLRDELEQTRTLLGQSTAKAAHLREQVAAHSSVLTGLPAAQEALRDAKQRAIAVTRWNRALTLLEETLREIHSQRRSNLAPRLNEELKRIMASAPLVGVSEAGVGQDLEIRLQLAGAKGKAEDAAALERLSTGARQQLALALRMAVAATLAESTSLPVILDEPLADLDDERSTEWLAYLAQVASGSQVLLTSCHEQQYEWLEQTAAVKLHRIGLA